MRRPAWVMAAVCCAGLAVPASAETPASLTVSGSRTASAVVVFAQDVKLRRGQNDRHD